MTNPSRFKYKKFLISGLATLLARYGQSQKKTIADIYIDASNNDSKDARVSQELGGKIKPLQMIKNFLLISIVSYV
jgi:hypothetical protein